MQYLLPQHTHFYKANLHCHTVISDGKRTPEEIKEIYRAQGYSVVAFTDHNVFIPHNDLTDADFLALNGYEINLNEEGKEKPFCKTCHLCLIARNPEQTMQVCYHREKYLTRGAVAFRDAVCFDQTLPDFERVYNAECVNTVIKTARESGFYVTYNHPVWSMESADAYLAYQGMHAMEVCNYGCVIEGHQDHNEVIYDEMLRGGARIFCIATDDNHNKHPLDDPRNDSFGGFTMIAAPELTYTAITDALLAGNFYASEGPQIHTLTFDAGTIHITCSEAVQIYAHTGRRRTGMRLPQAGSVLTEADFTVSPEDVYIRITVVDKAGNRAYTNAYFTDTLFAAE